MNQPGVTKTFDLSRIDESGRRAILDALRLDREKIPDLRFDQTSRVLEIKFADSASAEQGEQFVDGMVRTHRRFVRKIVRENRPAHLHIQDIDARVAVSKDVHVLGDGLIGLSGSFLKLFRFFEAEFLRLSREFGAAEHHYPSMIPSSVLAEVKYFGHFPQHVTFCSHLPGHMPLLESLTHGETGSDESDPDLIKPLLESPRHALIPGVCFPCYRQFRGITLQPDEVKTLTMQGHVYRYEGANFRPLTRGWDFTVRDIVFFGAHEDMVGLRNRVMDRTIDLCRELDLAVTIELANDPFFLDANRDKTIYQRMGEVKYELLFQLPYRGEALAASSFNLHRDFYTSIYDTRQAGGQVAESACMGFGVDRWVYGFLSQKGFDQEHWPERVKSHLAD